MAVSEKKKCKHCQKEKKNTSNFYKVNSPLFPDGCLDICTVCIRDIIPDNDQKAVQKFLREINKPFLYDIWEKSTKQNGYSVGNYLRAMNMGQYASKTWDDSVFEVENTKDDIEDDSEIDFDKISNKKLSANEKIRLVTKFGKGYSDQEYIQMENFYDDMISCRDITTPEHKKLLSIMCRLQVKMERALEKDDYTTFEKLHRQYQELIKNSGFRPIDKVASDVSSGIRTFSQIFAEVERDGFIKPTPITFAQDIVDRSIQYIANYQLKLMNMQVLSEPPADTPKVDEV